MHVRLRLHDPRVSPQAMEICVQPNKHRQKQSKRNAPNVRAVPTGGAVPVIPGFSFRRQAGGHSQGEQSAEVEHFWDASGFGMQQRWKYGIQTVSKKGKIKCSQKIAFNTRIHMSMSMTSVKEERRANEVNSGRYACVEQNDRTVR